MMFSRFMLVALAVCASSAISPAAHAQFTWDGDCGLHWYDCCNTGSVENPEWRNNWTIAPSSDGCPAFPGPDDHVTVVKTVIMQTPVSTAMKSLTVTSTIDQAVQFSTFNSYQVSDFFVLSGNIIQPAYYQLKNGTGGETMRMTGAKPTATISSYATLDFQFDGFINGPATGLLTNDGLILKSVGHDAASGLNIPVENNGTITAADGTMVLVQDCTNNGIIEALDEAEIRFQGQNTVLGGEVRGDGLVRFVWASASITGDYHPANTLIAGGGAVVNFDADTSVENLTLGNSCTIGGTGDLTIDDLLWNGGYSTFAPGGATIVHDTMLIQHDNFAGGYFAINRDMDLQGDSVIDSAQVYVDNGELRNYGELQMIGSNIVQPCCVPDSVIQNFGTLRKVSGAPSIINVVFLNLGDVAVESGSLEFGEMQNDGSITVGTGTTLLMAHPQQINLDLGSITGPGTVTFVNDQHNPQVVDAIAGVYDVGTTAITGAQVEFLNDASTATLNLNFPSSKLLGDEDFVVTEHFNWSAGEMAGTGTTIVYGPMILNYIGYWLSLGRTLELNVDAPIGPQPPSVTLAINPQGTLRCKNVTIDGHVNNSGVISPGTVDAIIAQLHLTGGYTQTSVGQLSMDKDGAAHDQLIVDGAATLGGILNVSGFPVSGGQSFTILNAQSISGAFSVVNAPAGMQVIYTPTSVILQAAPGDPCPADIAPQPDGNGVVDVDDLLAVINAWGICDKGEICSADIVPPIDGNGVVDVDDLLAVINAWGPCDS